MSTSGTSSSGSSSPCGSANGSAPKKSRSGSGGDCRFGRASATWPRFTVILIGSVRTSFPSDSSTAGGMVIAPARVGRITST